jgi:hypothetical protein
VTQQQAKEILLLYRPGTTDAEDPEVVEALALARHDRELARWFDQQQAFQIAMRAKFRQVKVPEHLRVALLASQKVVPLPVAWWQRPAWLAAAAVILVFLGLAAFWSKPQKPDTFADYLKKMVWTAENPYFMDLTNSDMRVLRATLAEKRAPTGYALTPGLQKLPLTGGAALKWRNNTVSMLCFDRGNKQMVFLFVLQRSALKDPPPETPKVVSVDELSTASWSQGELTYVLAGRKEAGIAPLTNTKDH